MTFLRNHKNVIAGMDFFVVPTVRFRLLHVWFVIDHGRRSIMNFNVTPNATAQWVIQQLREAFPYESVRGYLVYDNDSIFSVLLQFMWVSGGADPAGCHCSRGRA